MGQTFLVLFLLIHEHTIKQIFFSPEFPSGSFQMSCIRVFLKLCYNLFSGNNQEASFSANNLTEISFK